MPLTQALKDAAIMAEQQTGATLAAWPDDTPEKPALVSASGTLLAGIQAAVVPPPGPTESLDPRIIYDVPLNKSSQGLLGSTTKGFLYTPIFPWKNPCGDWTDSAGTAQGNKPFGASAQIALSYVGQVVIPLPGLPADCTQLCLRAKAVGANAPTIQCNSRSTLAGPQIVYTDGSGEQTVLNALADVELNTSTDQELGGNPLWTLRSNGVNVFVRFPPAPAGTVSVNLVLSVVKVADAAGIIEVYDGTVRLGKPPTDSMILKGDSRVFFETQCFEDAPKYIQAYLFGDPQNSFALDTYHQRNIVVDETGSKVLQITFDPAVNRGASFSVLFPYADGKPGAEAIEAACEFDVRFLPDLETGVTQGFKCAFGWSSNTKRDDITPAGHYGYPVGRTGTLLAGNGGAKTHGDDGWSMRWDVFAPAFPSDHPMYQRVVPMQYVYWPGQLDYYGDPWPWDQQQWSPRLGEWHTFTQRLKVNSVNADGTYNKDAEHDGYADNKLASRHRGFYLRTTDKPLISQPVSPAMPWAGVQSTLAIGRIWFNAYHGGTALPRSRCSFQIRNFRAAKFA